jgi:hypothetical protein
MLFHFPSPKPSFNLLREQRQWNCLSHRSISRGRWMQVVSAIIGGKKTVGMLWIENNFVEVDDGIKVASGADPYVDRLAICLTRRAGMVIVRSYVRGDGRTIDAQPVRMCSLNDLLVRGNDLLHSRVMLLWRHLCGARQASKIVHTFEHDHPAHAGRSQHITIESR